MEQKYLEHFTKNNCKKKNPKEFRVEKVIKRKGGKLYVKWKDYDNSSASWIDKKDIVYMSKHFPEPKSTGKNLKGELDLCNYAAKSNLKNPTSVDTSILHKRMIQLV